MELIIGPGGAARCIYSEAVDLAALGRLAISRTSHVEPTADGQLMADLAPIARAQLEPFPRRSLVLAAEAAWLVANWLTISRS